jgi:hypothetical protein
MPPITPPAHGLMAMRIGLEYGSTDEFVNALERALTRGGERGVTVVADIGGGALSIHLPADDGPPWNCVPLLHLRQGDEPSPEDWAGANAVLEKLERFR